MRFIVDRIEGNIAVLESEGGDFIHVPVSDLPKGIRDGSVIRFDKNVYEHDALAEQQRRRALFEKQQSLLNRKK